MPRFAVQAVFATVGLLALATSAHAQSTAPSGAQSAETHASSKAGPQSVPARGPGSSTEMKTNGNPGAAPTGPYTTTDSPSDAGGVTGANGPAASTSEVKAPPSPAPPGGAPSGGESEAPNVEGGPH